MSVSASASVSLSVSVGVRQPLGNTTFQVMPSGVACGSL